MGTGIVGNGIVSCDPEVIFNASKILAAASIPIAGITGHPGE